MYTGVLDDGSHALDTAPLIGVGIGIIFPGVLDEGSHALDTAPLIGVGIGVIFSAIGVECPREAMGKDASLGVS